MLTAQDKGLVEFLFPKCRDNPAISLSWADLEGKEDWVVSHPPFGEAKHKKTKKIVNIMANALDRYM